MNLQQLMFTQLFLGLTFLSMQAAARQSPIRFAGQDCELTVTEVGDYALRVTLTPKNEGQGTSSLVAGPVPKRRTWPAPALKTSNLVHEQTFVLKNQFVTIKPSPLTIEVASLAGEQVQRLSFDERSPAVTFRLGRGPVLGLGGGGAQFDRRGSFDAMNNGHRAGEYQIFGSRVPIPFLIGTEGRGLFLHRPFRASVDLRGPEGRLEARALPGPAVERPLPLDLFVLRADTPSAIMAEYGNITGKPVMPPKWAIGYMQSHRTLAGRDEVLAIAETFRRKRLPCDALIYLGTGYTPSGWNTGHGSLEFNPKVFHKPAEVLDKLHSQHFKVILHVNNAPRTLHREIPPAAGERTGPDQVATYWARHEGMFKQLGVDGWWPDDGDELHIDARLARHRAYFNGSLMTRAGQRPFSLHRTGYAGIQHYGAWVWSGDVFTLWDTLAAHVPIGVNFSLSAPPFWGSDTGGFTPTRELTGELYVRWFQFSSFTPSFRSHGRIWHTRLPWGWNTGDLGPNEVVAGTEGSAAPDPSELHNAQIEPICKRYLELRYRLMPYLYTAVREAHDTGMPIMRALWLHYPDDPRATVRGDEYLWGRDILVAPVVAKGTTHRTLYLPSGRWYDYWSRTPVIGGQEITRYVNLSTMPLYVRAGAILPLDPPRQYVDEPTDQPSTIAVYTGVDGEFVLYEDDGASLDYLRNVATWTGMRWDDHARCLTIEPREKSTSKLDRPRRFVVRLVPSIAARTVEYTGERSVVKFD
jgi:alpha-glucosidase (family GH31 glycosyl hydrolase)